MPGLFNAGRGFAWSESLLAVPLTASMQATEPAAAGDASNARAMPGGGHGGPTSCLVSRAEVRDAVKERIQPLSSCL